jgi:hypothetical protein
MKLLDVITAAGARTSGGDPFLWKCFGDNAQYLEFRDENGDGYSHCIFDTKNYTVYQIHVDVPKQDRAFQWTNPDYVAAYHNESIQHDSDPSLAWDDVVYTIVDDEDTILEYVENIGSLYYDELPLPEPRVGSDGRVSVPLDLTDKEQLRLMTLAHEADMTLNKYVEMALQSAIDAEKEKNKMIMDMPGTIGGAKLVFPKDDDMNKNFMVKLDLRFELDVSAESADQALKDAHYWVETMKHNWGEGTNIVWHDKYVVKESVEREVDH